MIFNSYYFLLSINLFYLIFSNIKLFFFTKNGILKNHSNYEVIILKYYFKLIINKKQLLEL